MSFRQLSFWVLAIGCGRDSSNYGLDEEGATQVAQGLHSRAFFVPFYKH